MAKAIMIQGTMSNSGKTFVTAGLCRVFKQDGYKVAPFKSQNMALNSYITKEGLEIGRAQAMQAEAAMIEPTHWMNPILLKPTSNMGSQVIVNGEVYDNLSAQDYYKMKDNLAPEVMKAFRHLSEENDIIVIEGAGSPAEINLAENDETVRTLFDNEKDLMVQELMTGQEYGCDLYIDLISGKCTSLFLKKKIRMRAGETDKSVSVKDEKLFARLAAFAEKCGFRGMIDMDLFHDEHGLENENGWIPEGEWYLSEVNPRFGGGYPHAYACGVDFPTQMLANLRGEENPVTIGDYESGVVMMKYNEIAIRKEGELAE